MFLCLVFMELPLLNPEEEHSGETSTFYHGFGCTSNLEGILYQGALTSKGRREPKPDSVMREQLYEDILRHAGSEFTQYSFDELDSVEKYLEEHRSDFIENGQEFTQYLAEQNKVPNFETPDFMGKSAVWISKDNGEASNYATSSVVPGAENSTGGYFELELPEESVLQFGVNGVVPGKIPLEYAEELAVEEASEKEYHNIWGEFLGSKYDIKVSRL